MTLTIAKINVRSVRALSRAQSILSQLSTLESDLFLLQECSLPFMKAYTKWEQMWSAGPSIWSGSNLNRSDKLAILIKNPHIMVKGGHLAKPFFFLETDFNILNVYGFNDKFLEDLQHHLLGRVPWSWQGILIAF